MSPGIVNGRIETGLKPHQQTGIAGGSILFYHFADKLARRLYFVVEFTSLCVKPGANGRDVIRWRPEFLDNDSPEVKRALHRTNIGSRKIAISRNVAPGKFIQLAAHLYDRRHRQKGGNSHQHDQYDRDPHDLPPNGQADHVLTSPRCEPRLDGFTFRRWYQAGSYSVSNINDATLTLRASPSWRSNLREHEGDRWVPCISYPAIGPRSNSGGGFSYV